MSLILSVASQLLSKTSVAGAVMAIAAVAAVCVLFFFAKTRIEIMKQESERLAKLSAQKTEADEAVRGALMDGLKETRQQLVRCIEQGNRERNRSTRTMGSLCAEMRAQAKLLESVRASVDACATRISSVKEEMIRLEGSGGA